MLRSFMASLIGSLVQKSRRGAGALSCWSVGRGDFFFSISTIFPCQQGNSRGIGSGSHGFSNWIRRTVHAQINLSRGIRELCDQELG